ncbi:carbamoyltransferase [Roseivirga sp. BDSF3-8]|uniref:carbamoyltransferase family protein n=1 Tax=Roseivirga sp. BDSF3-8 TaxID=3241598 RepID=UPI0035319DBE
MEILNMPKKPIYILGTGLSHDGSSCLLKDGKVCVAIEKERITRQKHDGGNDNAAIEYCLRAEGITIDDVSLIVQNATLGNFKYGSDYYDGERLFSEKGSIPIVTISHHLAHAYSCIGTSGFDNCNILIVDGMGNPYDECMDLQDAFIPDREVIEKTGLAHLFWEKDSYYAYDGKACTGLYKDFSDAAYYRRNYPMYPDGSRHSIGNVYNAASNYCFGNMMDVGKLMGLGPYGRPGIYYDEIYELKDGRVFVNYDWMGKFKRPARSYAEFRENFQYYADIAYWVQRETERALIYLVNARYEYNGHENLCYAGGVALNAVANARIIRETPIKNLYMQPAAGDNGIALGCAYYGWLEVMKEERQEHDGSTCFGISYPLEEVQEALDNYLPKHDPGLRKDILDQFFKLLPSYTRQANVAVSFNVSDYGFRQVVVSENEVAVLEKADSLSHTSVTVSEKDLYLGVLRPYLFQDDDFQYRFTVNNEEALEQFMMSVDWAGLSEALQQGLQSYRVSFVQDEDYLRTAARLIAEGNVLGWFQQGCEFGPRALGRRSILADPRDPAKRDFINARIKFREDFRPFAPSVPAEDVAEYFKYGYESPYMILVDQIRDEYRDKLKSIVHKDNSCRVQTVTPDWSPRYYGLLRAFKEETGVSVMLNTSFNKKGMPIVERPEEALDLFYETEMDYLVIENFIISKSKDKEATAGESIKELENQVQ